MDIKIVITESTKAAEQAIQRVIGGVNGLGQAAAAASRQIGDKLTGALVGFAKNQVVQAFGAGALLNYAKQTLDWADSLQALSERLSVSTDELQVLETVAKRSNISIELIARSLKNLTLAKASAGAGKGEKFDAFASLGIGIDQVRRSSAEQLWRQVGAGVDAAKDKTKAFAAAVALLGQNADQVLPAMKTDLAGIREEMERSGQLVSAKAVEDLARQKMQLDAAGASLKGTAAPLLSMISTGLEAVGVTIGSGARGFVGLGHTLLGNKERADELSRYSGERLDAYGERYARLYGVDYGAQAKTGEMQSRLDIKLAERERKRAEEAWLDKFWEDWDQGTDAKQPGRASRGGGGGVASRMGTADALTRIGLYRSGSDTQRQLGQRQLEELKKLVSETKRLREEVSAE